MYTLEVTLLKAQDLPKGDFGMFGFGGKSDPYFTFKVGRVTHKSSVIAGSLSPVWNPPETVSFQVDSPKERVLEVRAFDYDRVGKDDALGATTLALAPFLERAGKSEALSYELELPAELSGSKSGKRAFVFLEIKLTSSERADRVLELWENQRYHIVRKWTTETFLPGDRRRWSSVGDASAHSDNFEEVAPKVPAGLRAEGWTLDVAQGDDNGWIYAPSFQGPWQKSAFSLALVRRRKWINRCTFEPNSSAAA